MGTTSIEQLRTTMAGAVLIPGDDGYDAYDPANVFHRNANIRPSAAAPAQRVPDRAHAGARRS